MPNRRLRPEAIQAVRDTIKAGADITDPIGMKVVEQMQNHPDSLWAAFEKDPRGQMAFYRNLRGAINDPASEQDFINSGVPIEVLKRALATDQERSNEGKMSLGMDTTRVTPEGLEPLNSIKELLDYTRSITGR
jgi:hypothetical protein